MVLKRKTAISGHAGGRMADKVYGWTIFAGGPRAHAGKEKCEVTITKALERDSSVVKHPAIFRTVLPVLAKRFPCYVIVRNPLSILASGRFGEGCLPVDSGGAGLGLSYGAADL